MYNTTRQDFISQLFSYLQRNRYVALKYISGPTGDLPLSSDLDLLVEATDIPAIHAFCQQHELVSHLTSQTVSERHSLHLYFTDGAYLKIDLLTDLICQGMVYMDREELLDSATLRQGVKSYTDQLLLAHVVFYYWLNGAGVPAKYLQHWAQWPTQLLKDFNEKYGLSFGSYEQLGQYQPAQAQLIRAFVQSLSPNQGLRSSFRRLRHALGRMGQLNRGKIITFTGVDGAGKTTLLYDMATKLREVYGAKVVILRHRPGILPILSAWRYGRTEAEQRVLATPLPRQGSNHNTWASWLRFLYYYADYLLGQGWVKWRYCRRGYTVLYDRYYFDFVVDGRRSNISLPSYWPRQLYRFIHKPDLNFFLFADAETIRARKQELSQEAIEQLTQDYRYLFLGLKAQKQQAYHIIRNDQREQSLTQMLISYHHIL